MLKKKPMLKDKRVYYGNVDTVSLPLYAQHLI